MGARRQKKKNEVRQQKYASEESQMDSGQHGRNLVGTRDPGEEIFSFFRNFTWSDHEFRSYLKGL